MTSARASALYVRDHMPSVRRVLAVGASGLERELLEAGFEVVSASHAATRMSQEGIDGWAAAGHPDAVVVGLDPQLTYLKIAGGGRLRARRGGARGDQQGRLIRRNVGSGRAPVPWSRRSRRLRGHSPA